MLDSKRRALNYQVLLLPARPLYNALNTLNKKRKKEELKLSTASGFEQIRSFTPDTKRNERKKQLLS
jgi:hypothetical protein